jgi:hypothetical protein
MGCFRKLYEAKLVVRENLFGICYHYTYIVYQNNKNFLAILYMDRYDVTTLFTKFLPGRANFRATETWLMPSIGLSIRHELAVWFSNDMFVCIHRQLDTEGSDVTFATRTYLIYITHFSVNVIVDENRVYCYNLLILHFLLAIDTTRWSKTESQGQ